MFLFEKLKYLPVGLIPFVLLLSQCQRSKNLPENVEAYHLVYGIDYLEDRAGDIPTRILPSKMDAYYTKFYAVSSIEGFFNQFSLVQIADLRHRKVTTMLNFFGNKVYYEGSSGELPVAVKEPEKMNTSFTGEMTVIGGLNSERIEVDTGKEQFDIYCTRDFSVRRPNISTPYRDIDYPLSDFRVQLSLLKMHLTCTDYQIKNVESEIFSVPDGYRAVSHGAMEEIINSLFTKE